MAKTPSMQDLLGKLEDLQSDDVKELAKRFPQLGKAIDDLAKQVTDANDHLKSSARNADESSETLTNAQERMAKALDEVTEAVHKTVANQVVTAREAAKVAKVLGQTADEIDKERKVIRRSRNAKGHYISQAQFNQDLAKNQAALAKTRGVQQRRRFFSRGFGVSDDSEAGFLLARRRRDVLGGGARGAVRGLAERAADGGPLSALATAGPIGLGIAAVVGSISKLIDRRRETLLSGTERAASFGTTKSSGDLGRDVQNEAEVIRETLDEAAITARKFSGDVEATKAATVKIATETGKQWKEVGGVMEALERGRFMGLGTMDEMADFLIKRHRETGKSLGEVQGELEAITLDARSIAANAGKDAAVLMRDYFKAVQQLAEGMDSLHVSQKGLSKTMAANLTVARSMGMATDRSIRAAQGLTNSLVNQYDAGFATIDVYEELAVAAGSGDSSISADAKDIQRRLKAGEIDADMAQRLAREAGVTTDENVSMGRLARVLTRSGGNARIMEAQLGGNLSIDQLRLLDKFRAGVAAGKTPMQMMEELKKGDAKALQDMTDKLQEQTFDAKTLASTGFDTFVRKMEEILGTPLAAISGFLSKIAGIAEFIAQKLGMTVDPEAMAARASLSTQISDALVKRGTDISDLANLDEEARLSALVTRAKGTDILGSLKTPSSAQQLALLTALGGDNALLQDLVGKKVITTAGLSGGVKEVGGGASSGPGQARVISASVMPNGDVRQIFEMVTKSDVIDAVDEQRSRRESSGVRRGSF